MPRSVGAVRPRVTARVKRWAALALGPFRAAVLPWALSAPPSIVKTKVLRRIVVPNLREKRLDFSLNLDDGFVFEGNTRDLLPRTVYLFRTWEPALTRLVRSRLRPGDVFIDVGANLGWFTVLAGVLVGEQGRVVAIEPAPSVRAGLVRNIEVNGLTNVDLLFEAASAAAGQVRVVAGPPEHTGVSEVVPGQGTRSDILPELVGESVWRAAKLIKIDVESSVYDVVQGLAQRLHDLPSDAEVVVEFGGHAEDQHLAAALIASFADAGFYPYHLAEPHDLRNYTVGVPGAGHSIPRAPGIPTHTGDFLFARVDEPELRFGSGALTPAQT